MRSSARSDASWKEQEVDGHRGRKGTGGTPKDEVRCPLLQHTQRYLAFCGNGKRWGCGYRIIGNDRTGWLFKCGYGEQARLNARSCREFLRGIESLASIMGLVAVGVHPQTGEWHDMPSMLRTAGRRVGWRDLDLLHIRIYAPEDYEARLRSFVAERGGFPRVADCSARISSASIAARMNRLGLHHQDLADHLGTSRPFVTKLLNGAPWPHDRLRQTEVWLAAREANSEGHVLPQSRSHCCSEQVTKNSV